MTKHKDDEELAAPKVIAPPASIFLNYGDIDEDCVHEELVLNGEVTWCDDRVFASDIEYVRKDVAGLLRK